jgi:hypothetical protein
MYFIVILATLLQDSTYILYLAYTKYNRLHSEILLYQAKI